MKTEIALFIVFIFHIVQMKPTNVAFRKNRAHSIKKFGVLVAQRLFI